MLSVREEADWVVQEFGEVDLGDQRRTERLLEVVTRLSQQPDASFPQASGGDWASLKATYRLLDNAAVTHQALLSGHVGASWERIEHWGAAGERVVLVIQDSTELDFSSHRATSGLGQVGNRYGRGLLAHSTLACTVSGVPLGLLAQAVWARTTPSTLSKAQRKQRPIAEKESYKWLAGLAAVVAGRAQLGAPETLPTVVVVGDAESDVYEYFCAPRPAGVELLVRAAQDRRTVGEEPAVALRALLARQPASPPEAVAVPRQQGQPARTAQVVLRWAAVTLAPPQGRATGQLAPVPLWAVWVSEGDPPAGVEPLDWLLLTTVPVHSQADAQERVAWYRVRWTIEVWHHVLTSGCAFEQRQLASAENLTRALALYAVIAWRILYGTLLARVAPEVPCTVLFEVQEWQALYCAVHKTPTPPSSPPTLGQSIRWLAELGGFVGRTGDGQPGVLVLWRGLTRLVDFTYMFQVFVPPRQAGRSG
jgi:Transposase DNA-binding/Transposase Tn5 dimerisation domain